MKLFSMERFRDLNRERVAYYGTTHSACGFVATLAEELGEVAQCVLGITGEKARKAHLTKDDLANELADMVTYIDLLAQRFDIDLGEAIRAKFNAVSLRVGFPKVL